MMHLVSWWAGADKGLCNQHMNIAIAWARVAIETNVQVAAAIHARAQEVTCGCALVRECPPNPTAIGDLVVAFMADDGSPIFLLCLWQGSMLLEHGG